MTLLDSIKAAQEQKGWSDGEFSRQLGMSPSAWSRIQAGKREMGLDFIRAVARVFPELQWQLADYAIKGGNINETYKEESD